MIVRVLAVLCATLLGVGRGAPGRAAELKIGITQFPSTLNPHIDSMLAKSYVLAMTQRPVTAYDQDWNLIRLLCVELPTLENGAAKLETQADGRPGIAVTYRLNPKATWGDGTPVTSADMVFTWQAGRHPKSGFGNFEAFRRITAVDVIDEHTFTLHVDRVTFDYNGLSMDLLPAHLERPIF